MNKEIVVSNEFVIEVIDLISSECIIEKDKVVVAGSMGLQLQGWKLDKDPHDLDLIIVTNKKNRNCYIWLAGMSVIYPVSYKQDKQYQTISKDHSRFSFNWKGINVDCFIADEDHNILDYNRSTMHSGFRCHHPQDILKVKASYGRKKDFEFFEKNLGLICVQPMKEVLRGTDFDIDKEAFQNACNNMGINKPTIVTIEELEELKKQVEDTTCNHTPNLCEKEKEALLSDFIRDLEAYDGGIISFNTLKDRWNMVGDETGDCYRFYCENKDIIADHLEFCYTSTLTCRFKA